MIFEMGDAPRDPEPCVGDVYRAKGPGPTRYWIVLARSNTGGLHMLGLDVGGSVVSTASYGAHAMEFRQRVGRCHDLQSFRLPIAWEDGR